MAGETGSRDAVHHPGQSVGERLGGELQLSAEGFFEGRDLRHAKAGADPSRAVAGALQHGQATQLIGLQAARPGNEKTIASVSATLRRK